MALKDNKFKTFNINKEVTINTKNADNEAFIDFREDGSMSFITRDAELINMVAKEFGREAEPVVIRLFHRPPDEGMDVRGYVWGKPILHPSPFTSTLYDATRIQNIAAFEGLAPRVYAIIGVTINGTNYVGQLVQDAGRGAEEDKNKRIELYKKIEELCWSKGIQPPFGDLDTPGNVINGLWVDWQGCRFTDSYEPGLKERAYDDGLFGDHMYQTIPEFGIVGLRDTTQRVEDLGFKEINWEGKWVHDCGCSSGMFCEYAVDAGAKRVVGTDHGHVIRTTREISNYRGYFNIDYHGMDINVPQHVGEFDITLFLSMYRHVKYPQWVHDSTKGLLLFELNKPDDMTREEVIEDVCGKFDKVEKLKNNTDFHDREIFRCFKTNL